MTGWRRAARTAGRRSASTCGGQPAARAAAWRPASTTRPSCGRRRFWEMLYEPLIRRAAGLGRAATRADPDRYEKAYAFCDVLVVGAGPAGLAAALAAGRAGRARHPVRARTSRSAAGCWPRPRRSTAAGRGLGDARRGRAGSAAGRAAACRAPPCSAVYDDSIYGAVERVADHLPEPAAARAAPALLAHRRQARSCWPPAPSSGRWSSPATTGRA